MATPRLEINLGKIAHNTRWLKNHYAKKDIQVIGVTKAICGHADIVNTLINSGISLLGDSRIENIKKMQLAGITVPMLLLRTPLLSQVEDVAKHCFISHNTEISVIQRLSALSIKRGVIHNIILMIELGDLREGILPSQLESIISKTLLLGGVKIVGVGTNLACFGGIKPTDKNMSELSAIAKDVERQLGYKLSYISGGNSANYEWFNDTKDLKGINSLRIGESIYLGCDPLTRKPIPGLFTDAFTLVAEVIESNVKDSVPSGEVYQNAFGEAPEHENKGLMKRAILGLGLQDVAVSGLEPRIDVEVIGVSSDHLILNSKNEKLKVGKELEFDLNYAALLAAMTSSYVTKLALDSMNAREYCDEVEEKDTKLKQLWPTTPIVDNKSPLISLLDTDFELIFEPASKKNYKYFVREEIVDKVGRISKSLYQEEKVLIIRSVWRSFDHQQKIWNNKVQYLLEEHPEKSEEEINHLVSHFIAPAEKSMHSTGGAVDALIFDLKSNKVLDFGTNHGLDIDLNEKCFPYHPDISSTAQRNRKLLIDLFEGEEFICDNKEYWHFDYGNAVWATKMGEEHAFYDVVKRMGE